MLDPFAETEPHLERPPYISVRVPIELLTLFYTRISRDRTLDQQINRRLELKLEEFQKLDSFWLSEELIDLRIRTLSNHQGDSIGHDLKMHRELDISTLALSDSLGVSQEALLNSLLAET